MPINYHDKTVEYKELVEKKLYEHIGAQPQFAAEGMGYSVLNGGKRLRACLVLASFELLSNTKVLDAAYALDIACALEMIHAYSLIHDDLPCMDDDDFRRNKPSNHRVFGVANATLYGDGLQSLAFRVMMNAVVENPTVTGLVRSAQCVADGALHMVFGQLSDIENEHAKKADESTLRFIHENKTGALIKAAVLAGAYAAKADICAEQIDSLSRFSEQFGLLFQITDDILDVTGSSAIVGKTLGKDATQDKLTYVSLFGLDVSRELAKKTARQAIDALSIFSSSADYLIKLTEATVERTY